MEGRKERESNIELLRVVMMLLIIVYHIALHARSMELTAGSSRAVLDLEEFNHPAFFSQLWALNAVMPLGIIGNAVFILISGYFMAGRERIDLFSIGKKLLSQTAAAAVILVIASAIAFGFRDEEIIEMVGITRFNGMSWFVGYYFLIMVIAQLVLNRRLSDFDRKRYATFILVVFGLAEFSWSSALFDDLADGLETLLAGIFLYSMGGYIRRYNPFGRVRTWVFPLVLLALWGLITLSLFNTTETAIEEFWEESSEPLFHQSVPIYHNNSIVVLVAGICVFELFRRLRIPQSLLINYLAGSTFMIYLLHDSPFFYSLWAKKEWALALYEDPGMFLLELGVWAAQTFVAGVLAYLLYQALLQSFAQIKFIFIKDDDRMKNGREDGDYVEY